MNIYVYTNILTANTPIIYTSYSNIHGEGIYIDKIFKTNK